MVTTTPATFYHGEADNERYISAAQAADVIGCTLGRVYQLLKFGELADTISTLRKQRVSDAAIQRLLKLSEVEVQKLSTESIPMLRGKRLHTRTWLLPLKEAQRLAQPFSGRGRPRRRVARLG